MSASAGKVLILPKGEYDSGTTYKILDCVRYNKAAYLCKKTTTGNAPTDNEDNEWWMLLVIGSDVLGVKGDAEDTYRDGNVNLTPANLGIYPFTASTLPIGGLVPPSEVGDEKKSLMGDGSWKDIFADYGLKKVVLTGVTGLLSCRFPATGTNSKIKDDMEEVKTILSNPTAQISDWQVNFYDGYFTITGSISGTTDITVKFARCETLS